MMIMRMNNTKVHSNMENTLMEKVNLIRIKYIIIDINW